MNEYHIFEALKEAYETSTQNNNHFLHTLDLMNWDSRFQADGELYFTKGAFLFTTPSLDPFKMDWKPSAIFSDGSMLDF